ncbi:MAG: hypothetical protein HYV28_09305, partial [Ignavibacteriales bacterium]|nr:hypothetical protein [Ignavibacteriales bacterium]
ARLEILPYATGKAEYIGNDPNDPFNPGHKYRPGFGVDMKTGIGSSVTFNATINPDFGQVEVDPAVVNLSDVEVSFQEKRPFFTEGVSIFRFGQGGTNNLPTFNWNSPNIFYSRRIGRAPLGVLKNYDYADITSGTHILGAGKITGQVFNDWKIGTIHAVTQREMADISLDGKRSTAEIEPLTYYGVFRAQKDFNAGKQGLGILSTYTNRLFKDVAFQDYLNKDAFILALDGWTFLDENNTYVISGWAAGSRVAGDKQRMITLQRSATHYFQRPDAAYLKVDSSATSLSGYSGRVMLNKNRGRWTFNAAVGMLSPQFEVNDLGYNSYSDLINTHLYTSYRWNEPTSLYQQAGINAATYANFDFGGNKTSHGVWFGSYITLLNMSGGNLNFSYNPYTYNARRTRGGPLTLNPVSRSVNLYLYSDNRKWWVVNVGGSARTADDYSYTDFSSSLEIKVSPNLTVTVGPEFIREFYKAQWVNNSNGWSNAYVDPTAVNTYGRRYVFANLEQTTLVADIRMDWILSPQLSLQLYMQPLLASGNYSQFKTLLNSKSFNFMKYGENGSTLVESNSNSGEKKYTIDPDGMGPAVAKTIYNPDFNFVSFRGNAVLRWEYMPGSALFLVWTQSRAENEDLGDFQVGSSVHKLFDVKPDNIFMIKATYWFGV